MKINYGRLGWNIYNLQLADGLERRRKKSGWIASQLFYSRETSHLSSLLFCSPPSDYISNQKGMKLLSMPN